MSLRTCWLTSGRAHAAPCSPSHKCLNLLLIKCCDRWPRRGCHVEHVNILSNCAHSVAPLRSISRAKAFRVLRDSVVVLSGNSLLYPLLYGFFPFTKPFTGKTPSIYPIPYTKGKTASTAVAIMTPGPASTPQQITVKG